MNKIFNIISLMVLMVTVVSCAKSPTRTVHNAPSPLVGEGGGEGLGGVASFSLREVAVPRVYFPFDSDYIQPETADGVNHNIGWLEKNSDAYIILEGHCDKVGASGYNVELGDRRARSVKAYMIEHGIPAERIIMVVSYGSTRPLNPGHAIEDLRQNRRVEFVIR